MDLLKMPAVLSRLCIDREDGNREQVIAFADTSIEIRARISGSEINQSEFGIHCRSLPDRGAAVLPRVVVLRPGLMSDLAGTGNRVEGPHQISVFGVVRFHTASRAVLTTGKADDDPAIVEKRSGRNCVAFLPAFGLDGPNDFARLFIQSDEAAIQLADVDLAFADRESAARPAAADRRDLLVEMRLILPKGLAGFQDRKSTRLNSSHRTISYAVFCLKKKIKIN